MAATAREMEHKPDQPGCGKVRGAVQHATPDADQAKSAHRM